MITFLKQFVVSPKTTGALAPSSKALAECLVSIGCVRDASVVVEFGPGTGAMTEVIIDAVSQGSTFFAVELNREFVDVLRRRFPRMVVFHDSAANTREYLDEMGLDGCDCIISGLPWTNFDDKLQDELLDAVVDVLRPGGRFVTFVYMTSPLFPGGRNFAKKLHARFNTVKKTPTIWMNVPPAFAYCAQK